MATGQPLEDTEWNDILIEKGILPPRPQEERDPTPPPTTLQDRLNEMDMDELDLLLEEDMDDDRVLERYRQQRLAELKQDLARGRVTTITRQSFVHDVTEASRQCPVLVHLRKEGLHESEWMAACLKDLSTRWTHVKFVDIPSTDCIQGYPDRHLPTVLIYAKGDLVQQLAGLQAWSGPHGLNVRQVEETLRAIPELEQAENQHQD